MGKRKHGDMNWNRVLQWVLIALIVGIVCSRFSFWAIWWLPFLFFCWRGCGRGACSSRYQDTRKHKADDDIEYV